MQAASSHGAGVRGRAHAGTLAFSPDMRPQAVRSREEEERARAAREAAAREEAEIRGAERIEREGAPPGAG